MKTLTLSYLTVVSAALVAHAQAGGHGGGFGGGRFGFAGGGGGHFSAPAHFAAPSFHAAPSFAAPSFRAAPAFHAAPSFQTAPSFSAAPSVSFSGTRAIAPTRNFSVATARPRVVVPNTFTAGTQFNPKARLSSNWRGNTFVSGKDPRLSDGRSWDRDWRHNGDWRHDRDWWRHHRHNQFFIDGGYLLDEPYYYPGYGDYSYAPSYCYGDSATT